MRFQLRAAIFIASLSLGAGASVATCYAQSAAGGTASSQTLGGATTQVANPPVQKDAFQRANENLTNQTIYLQNQVKTLEADSADSSITDDQISQDTQGFCDGSSDSKQCLLDYTETERRQLEKITTPLIVNDTALHNLQSSSNTLNAHTTTLGASGQASDSSTTLSANPLTQPSVPTFQDLTPDYQKVQKPTGQALSNWINSVTSPPNPSDFYTTQTVAVDPSDPSLGTEQIVVIDSNPQPQYGLAAGEPQVNAKAYQQALSQWQARNSNTSSNLYMYEGSTGSGNNTQSFEARVTADATTNIAPKSLNPNSLKDALAGRTPSSTQTPPPVTQAQISYETGRNYVVQNFSNTASQLQPPAPSITIPTPANPATPVAQVPTSGPTYVLPFENSAYNEVLNNKQPAVNIQNTSNSNSKTTTTTDALYMPTDNIDDFINGDLGLQGQNAQSP